MQCHSTFGKILLGAALFFVVCGVLTLFDSDPDILDAQLGFLMFASLTGIPGFILCRRANRQQQALSTQIQGFIQSRDSFSIQELANATNLDVSAARKKLLSLIQQDSLDLVFDSDTLKYTRRDKVTSLKVIEHCHSCGNKIAASKNAEHQWVNCPYCGSTHA